MATVYTDSPIVLNKYGTKYNVRWTFTADGKTTTKTVATNQTSATYSFTPKSSEFGSLMANSASGELLIDIIPTSGSGQAYATYGYTLKMNESVVGQWTSKTPSMVLEYGMNGKIVAGSTQVTARLPYKHVYGSSIKVKVLVDDVLMGTRDIAGQNNTNEGSIDIPLGVFTKTPSKITYTIVDSRGSSKTIENTEGLTVYPYVLPSLKASAAWNDSGQPVLSFEETHQATVANESNPLVEFYVTFSLNDVTQNISLLDKTSPYVISNLTFDTAKTYVFNVFIKDTAYGRHVGRNVTLEASNTPMIDFAADGNTIAIFGAAPSTASEKSLILGDTSKFHCVYKEGIFKISGTYNIAEFGENSAPYITLGDRKRDSTKGPFSVVAGYDNTASGSYSLALGYGNISSGFGAIASGFETTAGGAYSFTSGHSTKTKAEYSTAVGTYNKEDTNEKYLFMVGNGLNDSSRSNAFAVKKDGDAEINGKSVNSLRSGVIGHWYGGTYNGVDTGTDNSMYIELPFFNNKGEGPLINLVTVDDLWNTVTVKQAGVYCFSVRMGYKPSTANKRVELVPFINGSRSAKHSCSFISPAVCTLLAVQTYVIKLNAGDTISFNVACVDSANVACSANDIEIIALDYEGKYK